LDGTRNQEEDILHTCLAEVHLPSRYLIREDIIRICFSEVHLTSTGFRGHPPYLPYPGSLALQVYDDNPLHQLERFTCHPQVLEDSGHPPHLPSRG
jgi:hypothetical protein